MAQFVNSAVQAGGPGFNPLHPHKKAGTSTHASDPALGGGDRRILGAGRPATPAELVRFSLGERSSLRVRWRVTERDISVVNVYTRTRQRQM